MKVVGVTACVIAMTMVGCATHQTVNAGRDFKLYNDFLRAQSLPEAADQIQLLAAACETRINDNAHSAALRENTNIWLAGTGIGLGLVAAGVGAASPSGQGTAEKTWYAVVIAVLGGSGAALAGLSQLFSSKTMMEDYAQAKSYYGAALVPPADRDPKNISTAAAASIASLERCLGVSPEPVIEKSKELEQKLMVNLKAKQ